MTTINNNLNTLNKKLREHKKNLKKSAGENNNSLIKLLEEKSSLLESAIKPLEIELETSKNVLQQTRQKIASTVHDLKVPVTIALLNLELAEYEEDAEEKTNFLIAVRRELEFLVDTIGNTLDLAKAETGQLTYQKQEIDLNELCNNLVSRLQVLVKDRVDLSLVNELPKNLPLIVGDKNKLARVMNNLISNSVKYTDAGYISLGGDHSKENGTITLYIRDTGEGIEEEVLPKIFDFFQGDANKPDSFGVGLAFVKTAIQAHGGTIEIESRRRIGTTVKINLPVA